MKLGILTLAVLALSGCYNSGDTQAEVFDGMGAGEVKLIRLTDGTKCAVLIGYQKGAISCDWATK